MIAHASWSVEHGMTVRRVGSRPESEPARFGSAGPRSAAEGRRVESDDDPCLVWIHGLGESSVSFEPVVAALPRFQHILVDLPGYGRAPWPEPAHVLPLPDLAAALSRWLANQPPAVLIGHSMGGVLAQLVAELAPTRGIINVDGNLTIGDCTFSAAASAYSIDEFVEHGFAAVRAKVYADGATRAPLRGYHAAMTFASPHVFHRHALDLVEMSRSDTLAPRLAALSCKVLYVAGVPDGICAASRARLTELRVTWRGVEPAGHWVYLDQLAAFAALVDTF